MQATLVLAWSYLMVKSSKLPVLLHSNHSSWRVPNWITLFMKKSSSPLCVHSKLLRISMSKSTYPVTRFNGKNFSLSTTIPSSTCRATWTHLPTVCRATRCSSRRYTRCRLPWKHCHSVLACRRDGRLYVPQWALCKLPLTPVDWRRSVMAIRRTSELRSLSVVSRTRLRGITQVTLVKVCLHYKLCAKVFWMARRRVESLSAMVWFMWVVILHSPGCWHPQGTLSHYAWHTRPLQQGEVLHHSLPFILLTTHAHWDWTALCSILQRLSVQQVSQLQTIRTSSSTFRTWWSQQLHCRWLHWPTAWR